MTGHSVMRSCFHKAGARCRQQAAADFADEFRCWVLSAMTQTSAIPRLLLVARCLLGVSALVFGAGAAITIGQAPCSRDGPWVLFSSISLAAAAAILFLVCAFLVRSSKAWLGFGLAVLVALVFWFFGFDVSIMACRGV